jgi:hypothetical protein
LRFPDFLRSAVLLFAGGATALAAVAIAGARNDDNTTLIYIALGWWLASVVIGLWLGRGDHAVRGIERVMAGARATTSLPELEPAAVIFNRLWAVVLVTIVAGTVAFLFPTVPAIAAGYGLLVAVAWRRQSAAVQAIEERDGVQFWVERTSPFKPTQLIRTPGFRRVEPTEPIDAI